jgi:hypothetical protein
VSWLHIVFWQNKVKSVFSTFRLVSSWFLNRDPEVYASWLSRSEVFRVEIKPLIDCPCPVGGEDSIQHLPTVSGVWICPIPVPRLHVCSRKVMHDHMFNPGDRSKCGFKGIIIIHPYQRTDKRARNDGTGRPLMEALVRPPSCSFD